MDNFIEGCVHSERLFAVAREDRQSTDPIMQQRFLQGSIVNTLTSYLRELNLPDGPSQSIHPSSRYSPDSDSDSEDDWKQKSKLKKSRRTTTIRCSGPARVN